VNINHGIKLGGIEVIREMEGMKEGVQGLVWSSSTVKDVDRAVELELRGHKTSKLIAERFDGTWIDGVALNAKELLIYLLKKYGLEEKA
jgi:hypothetical protein